MMPVDESQLKPSLCETLRPDVTETLLNDITRRIVDAFHPQQVILFGSYAYGTPHRDSDVDLLVVMESDESSVERIRKVRAIAKIPYLPMDVLVKTPEEIKTRIAMNDFFICEILTQGRVLFSHDAA
jgi:predicted nucleotidyltransferase